MDDGVCVSVIIPTFSRCDSVRRALASLNRQNISPELFEVVVSIDGSEDGTKDMVEHFASRYRLRALWQKRGGRAAACNSGTRVACGELAIYLDDDMEPEAGFVAAHRAAHANHVAIGVVGAAPVVFGPDSPPVVQYIGRKFEGHLEKLARPGYEFQFRDFYSGNFSIRRTIMLDLGGFDEDFIFYGNEDLELSLRLKRAGIRIAYSPLAIARQYYEKPFEDLARNNLEKGRTAVQLAAKHPETLEHLKLSVPGRRHWRIARSILVRLSASIPALSRSIVFALKRMERLWPELFYCSCTPALDYFYWLGASAELRARSLTVADIRNRAQGFQ